MPLLLSRLHSENLLGQSPGHDGDAHVVHPGQGPDFKQAAPNLWFGHFLDVQFKALALASVW